MQHQLEGVVTGGTALAFRKSVELQYGQSILYVNLGLFCFLLWKRLCVSNEYIV